MQSNSRSHSHFSHRTERLAAKLGLLIRDLPKIIGISARMVHGYRSGTYPITAKSWKKLEAAEKAAGIGLIEDPENCENTVRDREVEYRVTPSAPFFTPPPALDRVKALSEQVAKIQAELAGLADLSVVREFPMVELISRMKAAGAWPPSEEDGKLSPSALMKKYPLVEKPNQ